MRLGLVFLAAACAACVVRGSDEGVAAVFDERKAESATDTDAAVDPMPEFEPAPESASDKPKRRQLRVKPHPEMVEVRESLIPGAGQGLFAKVDIPDRTYIGFYRGRLVTPEESDAMQDTKEGAYLFFLPQCANDEKHDSIAGDMDDYISKVNYAPRTINRKPTRLQNVVFENSCVSPFVRLYATRGIAADEELFVDYGPDYDYEFMNFPEVQQFFLELTGIEPEDKFTWEHGEAK